MKRTLQVSALALAAALTPLAPAASAQKRSGGARQGAQRSAQESMLAGLTLPASDSVVFIEMRRLLSEALPRALAEDPGRLGEINADIEAFKTRTGIDPRAFEQLAAGSRLDVLPNGKVKIERTVAVARGRFQMAEIVTASTAAAKVNHREEKYAGKTIHVFALNEEMKLFGLLKVKVGELAVAELGAQTLAVGEPEGVRAALDAAAGRNVLKASDLAVLTQPRGAGSLVAFGSRVPAEATKGLDLGNPMISQSVASIREFYGRVGMTATGYDMQTTLRTLNAADAKHLGDTLNTLKQLAPMFIENIKGDRQRLARNAVESLRVTSQGNQVQLSLEVPQGDITTLVRTL